MKYIYIVVQPPSPPSISRIFSSSPNKTLYPWNCKSPPSSPPSALGNHHSFRLCKFGYSRYLILEKEMATVQYSCLENPVDREAWWAAAHRVAQSRTWLKRLSMHACLGEGNGSPFQCSCLENSRDGGAWWAAIYGVAQSWTRLKRLSSSSSRYLV